MPGQSGERHQINSEYSDARRAAVAKRFAGEPLDILTDNVVVENEARADEDEAKPEVEQIRADRVMAVAQAMKGLPNGGMRRIPGSDR